MEKDHRYEEFAYSSIFGVDLYETYYTATHDIPLLIQLLEEVIQKTKRND